MSVGRHVPGWGRLDAKLVLIGEDDKVRFKEKVFVLTDSTQCWIWTGGVDRKGYGKFWWNGQTGRAQRFAVLAWKGVFPGHFDTDHLCRNVYCVNPHHLEPVSRRENLLRGNSPIGLNARKTACIRGHPFNVENTYWYKGERACLQCRREASMRAYYGTRSRLGKA